MASRVEIIERRRLRVGDREIDLATLAPEGGGAASQEIEASGGAAVDETVVLGTRAGVYRFTVARADGGPLTVEAKPLGPHAEVTRLRVEGATLSVEGTVPAEVEGNAFLFARRRGEVMEVVVPADVEGERFRASLDLGELVIPGEQRDIWNLRLEIGRRGLRLGTHLDGIAILARASQKQVVNVAPGQGAADGDVDPIDDPDSSLPERQRYRVADAEAHAQMCCPDDFHWRTWNVCGGAYFAIQSMRA